jgi:hypothetical protein
LRFGVVLSPKGGALKKMLTPFRLGAGGRLGDGAQWMSWISHHDAVDVLHRAIVDPQLSGGVNAATGEPVTNATFTKILGRVLRRPAIAPMPAPIVRLAFGELGDALLLSSQRARPEALESAGFRFRHATLEEALRFELGRMR